MKYVQLLIPMAYAFGVGVNFLGIFFHKLQSLLALSETFETIRPNNNFNGEVIVLDKHYGNKTIKQTRSAKIFRQTIR